MLWKLYESAFNKAHHYILESVHHSILYTIKGLFTYCLYKV